MVNWSFLLFCFGSLHAVFQDKVARLSPPSCQHWPSDTIRLWLLSQILDVVENFAPADAHPHAPQVYTFSEHYRISKSGIVSITPRRPWSMMTAQPHSFSYNPLYNPKRKERFQQDFSFSCRLFCVVNTHSQKGPGMVIMALFYLGKKRRVCVHITNNRERERIDPFPNYHHNSWVIIKIEWWPNWMERRMLTGERHWESGEHHLLPPDGTRQAQHFSFFRLYRRMANLFLRWPSCGIRKTPQLGGIMRVAFFFKIFYSTE